MTKEVPLSEEVQTRKIIPFRHKNIPMMVYEDNDGITHIERDYRIFEADRENPLGHEGRIYRIHTDDPIE